MPHPPPDLHAQQDSPAALHDLEARVRSDLEYLCVPANTWIPERSCSGQPVCDVVIVGGGMCGQLMWFALATQGVRNVRIIDRSPAGFEGPWLTYARMETLRSPKHLTGPAFGIGSLTFQAWFRAKFGVAAWHRLDKIPRATWMEYLRWYRAVLAVPVENGLELTHVAPQGPFMSLTLDGHRSETVLTRKLVYATGREGSGRATLPAFVSGISRQFWAHSSDAIDFERLRDKKVVVVGAGASAVENAAEALEAGARDVRLIVRRKQLPTVNKMMGLVNGGFTNGFAKLPDEWRWRILQYGFSQQTPPPRGSMLRVKKFANAHFHFGQQITGVEMADSALRIELNGDHALDCDFLILGTGFRIDPTVHTELGAAAANILRWSDVYRPPADEDNEELGNFPYLGEDFSFREQSEGRSPWLNNIYCFNFAATASLGKVSGDIPGVSDGAAWLASSICARLYAEDIEQHWKNLQDYDKPELLGDEWTAGVIE